ncbi:MAG: c-type cytochrome, partial [Myxococcales bacterium]|nr:c-type cytochrome [Myxococcales bacterium]
TGDDTLRVACSGGELLTLDGTDGHVIRRTQLEPGLRDVVVDGSRTLVSLFRTADVLVLDGNDQITKRLHPKMPGFEHASLAWRMRAVAGGGVVLAHQYAQKTSQDVPVSSGGYGGVGCSPPIVISAVTEIRNGEVISTTQVGGMPVPTDVANNPLLRENLLVSSGALNEAESATDFVADFVQRSYVTGVFSSQAAELFAEPAPNEAPDFQAPSPDDTEFADGGVPTDPDLKRLGPSFGSPCGGGHGIDSAEDGRQALAVAVLPDGTIVTQSRDPWTIRFVDVNFQQVLAEVTLPGESRKDSGHDLFHEDAGLGIACASCHGEGGDDGVAWRFTELGPRRTQDLRGGLSGTEPLHWGGDLRDLPDLLDEVMFTRMGGPKVPRKWANALGHWIDSMPKGPAVTGLNPSEVAHGKALFESGKLGCMSCHNGEHLTNNATIAVGTGEALQVPRLTGLGLRAPYMHDGCASTLDERFTNGACGGGEAHGHVSALTDSERHDLVAYLKSL